MEPHEADAFASCPDFEVLSAWHDSELRERELEAHVASCPACQAVIATFHVIDTQAHEPIQLDAQALDRIKSNTRLRISVRASVWDRYGVPLKIAAAIVAVGAVFTIRYYHEAKRPEDGGVLKLAQSDGSDKPESMITLHARPLAPSGPLVASNAPSTPPPAAAPPLAMSQPCSPSAVDQSCLPPSLGETPVFLPVTQSVRRILTGKSPAIEPQYTTVRRTPQPAGSVARASYAVPAAAVAARTIAAAATPAPTPERLVPITARENPAKGAELPAQVRHVWVVDDLGGPIAALQALLPEQQARLADLLQQSTDGGVDLELVVDDRMLVRLVDHFHGSGYQLVTPQAPQPNSSNGIIFTGKTIHYEISIVGQ